MLLLKYQNFFQKIKSVCQLTYPFVLVDAYLHFVMRTMLTDNGFFHVILRLPSLEKYNTQISMLANLLEFCVLVVLGVRLTQKFSSHFTHLLGGCTLIIIVIASIFPRANPFSLNNLPIWLIIVTSFLSAKILAKINSSTCQISLSLLIGSLFSQIPQLEIFQKFPGIASNSYNLTTGAFLPLPILRNLSSWAGIINPFNDIKQVINSTNANANLAAALSNKNLDNVPFPINIHSIYYGYALLGGIGCTLGLLFALLICRQFKLVLENFVLSIFNFNAPLLWRLPVLFNLRLLIPFLISPVISMFIGFCAIKFKLATPAVYQIFSGTPSFLINFLGTNGNWGSLLTTVIAIAASTIIYLPFVRKEVQNEE